MTETTAKPATAGERPKYGEALTAAERLTALVWTGVPGVRCFGCW
jgi:hypothetical protein